LVDLAAEHVTVDETVVLLFQLGFLPAGATTQETVRIPTTKSPVLGGRGGERCTFGGRVRYSLPGTDLRVTVGPRTVNVYYLRGGKTEFVLNEDTKYLTAETLRDVVTAATGKA
jgi:hypothetical protein